MLLIAFALLAQPLPASIHCGTPLFDRLKPAEPVPLPAPRRPALPPQLGETRLMWLQNMNVMPPQQYETEVTCRGIGRHCYVMVDDSAWNSGQMDSADVARIIERFDNSSPRDSFLGVWFHNTTNLGQPPDAIDEDSLIYLIYYNIGTFHGYSFDGFWQFFDEYYDTTAMRRWGYHSNEVECVYLDCYPNDPSTDYRIAIAAHEFAHMIHWNYDPAESLWVNEGCAELAMWLFGAPDPISGFPGRSDNDLTKFDGSWNDYIKTYLWFLFLYQQYGGRQGTELIPNIVASPYVSIEGIDSAFATTGLAVRFEEVLDQWVLANLIRDTVFAGGRYGYFGERVPSFNVVRYHFSYPVSSSDNLDRWAGEYFLFRQGRNLELGFDGADEADFRLYVVGRDSILGRVLIDTVPLDSLQRGTVLVPGFDTAFQSVYLVPVNHTPFGRMGYAYTANAAGIVELAPAPSFRQPAPTLIHAGARLAVPGRFSLFGRDGRLALAGSGPVETRWLQPGVYWLEADGSAPARKLVVVP